MQQRTLLVQIAGKVQGVGYRAATQRTAASLGISGWVRNLPDGRVEACVQGPDSDLERILEWFHKGPPASRVDQVVVAANAESPRFTEFEIRR